MSTGSNVADSAATTPAIEAAAATSTAKSQVPKKPTGIAPKPGLLDLMKWSPKLVNVTLSHLTSNHNKSISLPMALHGGIVNAFVNQQGGIVPPNLQLTLDSRLAQHDVADGPSSFGPRVTFTKHVANPPANFKEEWIDDTALDNPLVEPSAVPLFILTPKNLPAVNQNPKEVIMHLHGGGYIAGDAAGAGLTSAIATRLGRVVASVDYRLATQPAPWLREDRERVLSPNDTNVKTGGAPCPAAIQDALTAYLYLTQSLGYEEVVLTGDSAGGGLCIALQRYLCHERPHIQLRRRKHYRPNAPEPEQVILPKGMITFSPFLQTRDVSGASYAAYHKFDFISGERVAKFCDLYASLAPESSSAPTPDEAGLPRPTPLSGFIQLIPRLPLAPSIQESVGAYKPPIPITAVEQEVEESRFAREWIALRDVYATFPPAFVSVGDAECLGDEGIRFARMLDQLGRVGAVHTSSPLVPFTPTGIPPQPSKEQLHEALAQNARVCSPTRPEDLSARIATPTMPFDPQAAIKASGIVVDLTPNGSAVVKDELDIGLGKRHVWPILPWEGGDSGPIWHRMRLFADRLFTSTSTNRDRARL
ncbi:hypothetical protein PYCC9005_000985 [Savitreella phatthalungensis]